MGATEASTDRFDVRIRGTGKSLIPLIKRVSYSLIRYPDFTARPSRHLRPGVLHTAPNSRKGNA